MAPRRRARWTDDREGAALRKLFDEGRADPERTIGTEHMNEVLQNNQDLFGHIENARNFHAAFRRVAAEYLTNRGMRGARRRNAEQEAAEEEDALPPEAEEVKDNNEGTSCAVSLANNFCSKFHFYLQKTKKKTPTTTTWLMASMIFLVE